jgi:hypothetical protein
LFELAKNIKNIKEKLVTFNPVILSSMRMVKLKSYQLIHGQVNKLTMIR